MDRRDSYAARDAQAKTEGGGDDAVTPEAVAAMIALSGRRRVRAAPVEDDAGINGKEKQEKEKEKENEEEEEEGYRTPTSPRNRLRAPDVCPGAPRLPPLEEMSMSETGADALRQHGSVTGYGSLDNLSI